MLSAAVISCAAVIFTALIVSVAGTQDGAFAAKKGLVNENGYIHFYRNGKLVKNEAVKVDGTTYFFSAKGRGFISIMSKSGNKAVSNLIDKVTFTEGMTKKTKLRRLYRKVRLFKYTAYDEEAPKTKVGWYKLAKKTTERKGAKCYGYAATSAVLAKAMGYKNVRIRYGRCTRPGKGISKHAWVTVGKYVIDGSYDNSYMWNCKNRGVDSTKLIFFMKTYDAIKNKNPKAYRVTYTKIVRTCKIS